LEALRRAGTSAVAAVYLGQRLQRVVVDLVRVESAQLFGETVAHRTSSQRDPALRLARLAQGAHLPVWPDQFDLAGTTLQDNCTDPAARRTGPAPYRDMQPGAQPTSEQISGGVVDRTGDGGSLDILMRRQI
jgi:hypothetical protein